MPIRLNFRWIAVALAVTAAIAIGAVFHFRVTPADILKRQIADDASDVRDGIQDRVNALAQDGCQARVAELLALDKASPIATSADIPAPLLADLVLCQQRGIFYAVVAGDLTDRNLMRFLTPAP